MKDIEIEQVPVKVDNKRLKSIKIAHLSDLHLSTRYSVEDVTSLIDIINSIDADIVVITGDMIDTPFKKISHLIEPFGDIKAPKLFVSGNHDYVYGYEALIQSLESIGVDVLDGKSITIKDIEFVGVADRYAPFFGYKRGIKEFVNRLDKPINPRIFLAHQPKDYKYAILSRSTLFLCGHTHGGQIYPFHYLVKITQPFIDGLYYRGDTAIFVNRGIGTWGIHKRYKAPAHIAVIEFV